MSQFGVKTNQPKNKNFFSGDEEENEIFSTQPRAKKLKKNGVKNYCKFVIILGLFLSFIYVMTPNSSLTGSPQKTATPGTLPMYLEIYLFNWTNPRQFNQSIKPHFTEHGPYVFREFVNKERVLNKSQTTTFQQKKTWYFKPSLSNGTLDDEITNLNPSTATVNYLVRNRSIIIKTAVDNAFKKFNQQLTVTKSVRQLLFDGYDDKLVKSLLSNTQVLKIPFKKFAWFYQKNNSLNQEEVFTVWTGKDDQDKTGLMCEWHDEKSSFHPGSCGFANSSYGDDWPGLNDTDTVSLFIPNICTSIQMKFKDTVVVKNVTGKKFVPSAETFDNGTKFSSKSCHCIDDFYCQPSGVLNISQCKNGTPIFVSYPHFYLADESYAAAVDGLNPEAKREFSLVIEEKSGVPLQVQTGIQMNFLIEPVEFIEMFKDLPRTFVPMIWYQEVTKSQDQDKGYFSQLVSQLGPVRISIIIFVVAVFVLLGVWLKFIRKTPMETAQGRRNFSRNMINSRTPYIKCPLN